jgi:hypothetical protein
VGDAPAARQVSGTIECSVPHLDVKNTVGAEVFHDISTKLDLNLAGGDARFLNVYGAPKHQPAFSGPLSLSIRARVTRGVVEPGSQLLAATPALELEWSDVTLTTQLGLSFGRLRPEPELNLNATLQNARLASRHTTSSIAGPSARQASATLVLGGVDLAKPLEVTGAEAALEARLANLAWFNGFVDPQQGRRFSGSADATFKLKRTAGGHGDGELELNIRNGRAHDPTFDVRSDVYAISRFRTQQEPTMTAQGAVSFRVSEGDTLLSLAVGSAVQKLLSAGLNLGALDGTVAFHAAERGLDLELTRAKCGAVSGRGYFQQPLRGNGRGASLLTAGPVRVGLRVENAQIETSPLVGDDWLEKTWRRLQGLPPQG